LPTMPKTPKSPAVREAQRHNPLAEEYAPSSVSLKQKPAKTRKRQDENGGDAYVDSKSSRKILELGQELADEAETESRPQRPPQANPAFDFDTRLDDGIEEEAQYDNDDDAWGEEEEEIVEEVEIDPEDLETFNKFMQTDDNPISWPGAEAQPSGAGTDLAALILQRIAEKESADPQAPKIYGGGDPEDAVELPEK
jgi:essential nuclear protein 1